MKKEKNCKLPAPMKIQPGDFIPGSLYLRLIEAYKEYDAHQKQIISRLQTDLDFLMFENPDAEKTLRERHELLTLRNVVYQLRNERELLLCQIAKLRMRND